MKTISIVNLKGGVGKTVTTVNMAAILAGDHGKKVLVIDADPQANATRFFGLDGTKCNTVAGIITGECDYIPEYIYDTSIDNVHCVPSEISLIESDIASIRTGHGIKALHSFLGAIKADNELAADFEDKPYDFTLIDCPPSFTAASVAAIYASDEIIIPIKIDSFAIDGMRALATQIENIRKIQPGVNIAGVLVTMWHKCSAVVQGEELLRAAHWPIYQTHIRRSDKVDESTFVRQSLDEYSSNCAATVDYRRFVKEYLGEVL